MAGVRGGEKGSDRLTDHVGIGVLTRTVPRYIVDEVLVETGRTEKRTRLLPAHVDIRAGTKVAGEVYATFEHKRPRADGLPEWLDLTVPDDRFVASTLSVQSDHPGSRVYVVTGDLNMQTKLAALGLPWFETPNP